MLSNQDAVARCETLIQQIQLLQTTTEKHQKDFVTLGGLAYQSIQDSLKKAKLDSMDDLIKQVAAELPKDKADEYLKTLDDMKPSTGLIVLLTGGAKDFLDIGIYLGKMVVSCAALAYASKIQRGLALESEAFGKLGQAYARVVAQRAVALEAAEAALGAANAHLDAAAISKLSEQFKVGTAEEISVIEEEGGLGLTEAEVTAEKLLSAERAALSEAEALAEEGVMAARSVARAGIYGLIAAIIIFGAFELFSSLRESEQAQQLKAMIEKVATARLYAQVEEQTAATYISLNVRIQDIAEAYPDRETDPKSWEKALKKFTDAATALIPEVDAVYAQLFKRDAESGAKVEEDPTLDQMKDMHQKQIEARREEAKKIASK